MKKVIVYLLAVIALISSAYASDLSDFPAIVIDNNNLDASIVVGDKAPSSDVLLQSNLVVFFGKTLDRPIQGRAKLASEIGNLDSNLISIGSPCYNNLSARILNFPEPCNTFIGEKNAIIKLIEHNGYAHIIIAGRDEEATKEAVNVLMNYTKHNLKGTEYSIEVKKEQSAAEDKEKEKSVDQEGQMNIELEKIELEKEKMIEELNKRVQNSSIQPEASAANEEEAEVQSGEEVPNYEVPQKQEENASIIGKIINWIFSLFK